MAKVCVFTADGFEEVEGLTVVDLLRRAGEEVLMVSISDNLSVTGSHGIEIKADVFFDDVDYSTVDLLLLPGGMPGTVHLGEHQGLAELFRIGQKSGCDLRGAQHPGRPWDLKEQKGSLLSWI